MLLVPCASRAPTVRPISRSITGQGSGHSRVAEGPRRQGLFSQDDTRSVADGGSGAAAGGGGPFGQQGTVNFISCTSHLLYHRRRKIRGMSQPRPFSSRVHPVTYSVWAHAIGWSFRSGADGGSGAAAGRVAPSSSRVHLVTLSSWANAVGSSFSSVADGGLGAAAGGGARRAAGSTRGHTHFLGLRGFHSQGPSPSGSTQSHAGPGPTQWD